MSAGMTVRDIHPGNKAWLRREARQIGVSTEELVRRLIHEKRTRAERRSKASEAFAGHFGGGFSTLPFRAGIESPDGGIRARLGRSGA